MMALVGGGGLGASPPVGAGDLPVGDVGVHGGLGLDGRLGVGGKGGEGEQNSRIPGRW